LAEAEELTQLAKEKEKGVRTMVGLQARQSPSIIEAKDIVAFWQVWKDHWHKHVRLNSPFKTSFSRIAKLT
jgi:hypothetical protein